MEKLEHIIQAVIVLVIIIFINILGRYFYGSIDLTEDKRFTLGEPTTQLLDDVDDRIYVEVFLEGEFPAGIKRLQTATQEMLRRFSLETNGYLDFEFKNPLDGDPKSNQSFERQMIERGASPLRLVMPGQDEISEKKIYPYAIFHHGTRESIVNLMEPDVPGVPREVILNNAAAQLEYKFSSAIAQLYQKDKSKIAITIGNGEASKKHTTDLEVRLRKFYATGRLHLDSVTQVDPDIDLLMLIRPTKGLSDRSKFLIDQYIMNGGKVIFMIDRIDAQLDDVTPKPDYIPPIVDPNLDDLLFRYGIRINPTLLMDLECSRIPMIVSMQGDKPLMDLKPWFYFPIVVGNPEHPVTAGLDRIDMRFVSTMDTIRTKTAIKKEIILSSSDYSRTQTYPMRLGFEIIRTGTDPSKFNKKNLILGTVLSGVFSSLYDHRVSSTMMQMLERIGQGFKSISPATKIAVISDGNIAMNEVDQRTGKTGRLGYNRFERRQYANADFLLNLVEYMLDEKNLLESRTKKLKLRLLDRADAQNKLKWRLINIALPLLMLTIFGILYQWVRRKRFA